MRALYSGESVFDNSSCHVAPLVIFNVPIKSTVSGTGVGVGVDGVMELVGVTDVDDVGDITGVLSVTSTDDVVIAMVVVC